MSEQVPPNKQDQNNPSNANPQNDGQDSGNSKPKLRQIIMSTLAAFIGIQSNRNRERDFTKGNIGIFIAAGFIFTLLFIFGVIAAVKMVLGQLS